jgi:hypothetical protein
VLGLDKLLAESLKKESSWRNVGFKVFRPDAIFHPGTADFSPGWFMQRHEVSYHTILLMWIFRSLHVQRLADDLYASVALRTREGGQFLHAISNTEILVNAILALSAQELYQIGMAATAALQHDNWVHDWYENMNLWISAFSGMQVIVNRLTPSHRDIGGSAAMYNLLVSTGTHESSHITLRDVQASMRYLPGTVVLVCGRVLRHEVTTWSGGERICIAHYMCDNVHNRLGLPRPDWVDIEEYTTLMEIGFQSRQGL